MRNLIGNNKYLFQSLRCDDNLAFPKFPTIALHTSLSSKTLQIAFKSGMKKILRSEREL